VWAYSLDGYARGAAGVGQGDLRFSTFYTYSWQAGLRDLAEAAGRLAPLLLPLWLVLFVPGLLVLDWLGAGSAPEAAGWGRWGMAVGLSVSVLALLWLWTSAIGLRLGPEALISLYAAVGLLWLVRAARRRLALRSDVDTSEVSKTSEVLPPQPEVSPPVGVAVPAKPPRELQQTATVSGRRRAAGINSSFAAMLAVLALSLAARLLAARDLALPPWVDSPHHYLIADLLAASGRVPENYAPALPVDRFNYHFGYHALAVSVSWLAGVPLLDVMLPLGQVLNALTALAAYTLAVALAGRARAGLAAACAVGLISYFPAYYLAWGRYTQLAGILILAPAMAAIWLARSLPGSAGRSAVWLGLLAAGLGLTHYRLAAFLCLFGLAALLMGGLTRQHWQPLARSVVFAALATAPWLARLAAETLPRFAASPQSLAARGGYNAFPVEYFNTWLERGWLALAAACGLWGVLRRDRAMLVLGVWVALTFGLLNIGPGTWLVNNNAWAITLFLPASAALGWGVAQSTKQIARWEIREGRLAWVAGALMAAAAGYAGALGWRAQVDVVRPVTVLATAADVEALAWLERHAPPGAAFLVNGWPWLNNAWASPDGGAWLMPLTTRRATLPPVDYTFQPELRQSVTGLYEALPAALEQGAASTQALALLRQAGVSHIYIGAKGGALRPEMFSASPAYRLVYSNGAAWVFEVVTGDP
jgi:hypothetical protein